MESIPSAKLQEQLHLAQLQATKQMQLKEANRLAAIELLRTMKLNLSRNTTTRIDKS